MRELAIWVRLLVRTLEAESDPPGLLLAVVLGGLMRSLASWAAQACQHLTKGQVSYTA